MVNQIKNKTFMFTGTLSTTRDIARRLVEELGGIASSSISRSTDYLVCGADQVGKSGKWDKAGLLGVTRVDEDFFWDLIGKARAEEAVGEEVLVHFEEGEEITDKQWEILAQVDGLRIMTTEQFERLLKTYALSYESPEKLERLVKEHSLKLLPPSTCRFCGVTIPYSIFTERTYSTLAGVYYCFNCKTYSDCPSHKHVWFDPKLQKGVYMCNLCGDCLELKDHELEESQDAIRALDYQNSIEYLVIKADEARRKEEAYSRAVGSLGETTTHYCKVEDLEKILESNYGFSGKCKVCGNVKFVAFSEIDESRSELATADFDQSTGSMAEDSAKSASIGGKSSITANMGNRERAQWEARYEKWRRRREDVIN